MHTAQFYVKQPVVSKGRESVYLTKLYIVRAWEPEAPPYLKWGSVLLNDSSNTGEEAAVEG